MIGRLASRIVHEDSGVTAMIVAIMAVALMGAAAMAIDISRFTYQRQLTRNAVEAGAQAGAFYLPAAPSAAIRAAIDATKYVDAKANPSVTPYCAVPYVSGIATYDSSTVSLYCKPGPVDAKGMYAQSLYSERCNAAYGICTLPCVTSAGSPPTVPAGYTCNTLAVNDTRTVTYLFGPAMKVFSASFGSAGQIAAACRGSACSRTNVAPMDIVVMADRTGSMSDADRTSMVSAIQSMLKIMTPTQQYVAFGGIGKSKQASVNVGTKKKPVYKTCLTAPASSVTASGSDWVAVDYSNDYLSGPGALNLTSKLLNQGLASSCFTASSTGTYLTSPLKFAARYLLGNDGGSTALAALPARSQTAQKAIIFETDGQPNEDPQSGTLTLSDTNEVGASNGDTACSNLRQMAALAKAQQILIITVGFGTVNTARCSSTGSYVRDVLASVASPMANGTPSVADSDCSTTAKAAAENSDGDYYYCAAGGSDLANIFTTAFTQLLSHSKFIRLP